MKKRFNEEQIISVLEDVLGYPWVHSCKVHWLADVFKWRGSLVQQLPACLSYLCADDALCINEGRAVTRQLVIGRAITMVKV